MLLLIIYTSLIIYLTNQKRVFAATIHNILLDANDAETCNLLCVQCNASAVFEDGHCECNFADDSDKVSGEECVQSIQREIQAIEMNMLSEDLTDEERNARSILKYRRRLKPGDAEKVAQYFINGGPEAGHSHFVRAFNEARDSAESATNSFSGVVEESNPEDGFHGAPLTSPISWNTCNSPLYMVSESTPLYASPIMQDAEMDPSTLRINPAVTYSSELYNPGLLGSLLHPHRSPLHQGFIRAVTFPAHVLHNVLYPRTYHHHPLYHHPLYHHPVYHRPVYHHRGIVRSSNFPDSSDGSDKSIIGHPCEKINGPIISNPLTARNNADRPAEQNVLGLTDSSQIQPEASIRHPQIPFYPPTEYQNFPYQYVPYYNPLMNMLHPVPNGYFLQTVSPYVQSRDPLISASNPHSFCENNVNTEQKSGVLTADKTVRSKDETKKSDGTARNNIPKEKKNEIEKNEINKS
ncbi:uncharacterized protein LOC105195450 isoform X1 [Solenopsis invicta]|uniref:uncharacterized protein LOC105195450 isoform X1 n=1 Tax=Solenopsis invicta TaxID=13686 RepID=UPI00193D45FD|nr:uncharacterized protein LOC105195450 isoform X1 [Solenopsis invicta]